MSPNRLSYAERAALREQALRQAHELRADALRCAWDALFGILSRIRRRPKRSALA